VCPLNFEEYDEMDEEMLNQLELLMGPPKKPIRLGRGSSLYIVLTAFCLLWYPDLLLSNTVGKSALFLFLF
jgi:hypothetical protein